MSRFPAAETPNGIVAAGGEDAGGGGAEDVIATSAQFIYISRLPFKLNQVQPKTTFGFAGRVGGRVNGNFTQKVRTHDWETDWRDGFDIPAYRKPPADISGIPQSPTNYRRRRGVQDLPNGV